MVAIADVYDALISRRAYKEPWESEAARAYLARSADTLFDPELVEIFLDMQPVIDSIQERFDY